MKKITLGIEGMSCSACSNAIEKYLRKQKGIISVDVNLVLANATIEFDDGKLSLKEIEKFIKEVGYKSTGIYSLNSETSNKDKRYLIIYGILILIVLYLSMFSMLGAPLPKYLSMHHNPINYATILLLLTIMFLIYGFKIFKSGIKSLIHGSPSMDTLVTIGVLSSFFYSIYGFYKILANNHEYVDNIYFESCCVIIYFIKLGRYIDKNSKNKTFKAISDLVQITPKEAYIKVNNEEKKVTIDEIVKDDLVICHQGEKIAVDGVITLGSGHVDESFITGESKPKLKQVGDNVIAGSINYDGYIEYKAKKIGRDSTISEIVHLVVEATNTKMPISRIVDKVSGIFVPCIMTLALLSFIGYLSLGYGFNQAIITFVTVLVVSCPCALGLATPLAIVISEGNCAKNGILVKNSETLELANKVNTVVFDKTGTLTYGKLKIAQMLNFSKDSNESLLEIACSVEKLSSHPIASAFINKGKENNLKELPVDNFESLIGLGVKAKVNNKEVIMGNSKILEKFKIQNNYLEKENELANDGNGIVYLAIDKVVVALFGVNDLIKESAINTIIELKKQNIETIMLTGDNLTVANKVASKIGIDKVIANVLPSKKAQVIKELKEENKIVMMCGDGINDSVSLVNADIGVSVSNGVDIAINSADVVLMNDNLYKILDLMMISKKTIVNIKENLFWAFFYNCLMIPLAMGLFSKINLIINPMIAGIAMVISSLTVILNALRLRNIKLKGEKENV